MRVLHWFRKDLRLDDNTALAAAAREPGAEIVPFYASDPAILGRPDIAATRVRFVLDALADLAASIERLGSRLALDHGDPVDTVTRAVRAARADVVTWNDEYEPALIARDAAVERSLVAIGVRVRRYHDRLLVPPDAVRTRAGGAYTRYGPFRRACEAIPIGDPHPAARRLVAHDLPARRIATLERLGFATSQRRWPGGEREAKRRLAMFVAERLQGYAERRDVLAATGTSGLSADLKFGTVSPRTIAAALRDAAHADRRLLADATRFVEQLRWRDFFSHVLFHHPGVEHDAFQPRYRAIRWRGRPEHADAWKAGATGFPVVDAGMRELAATGSMHNRARMIVASFLTKDLLLDWRIGERHFMRQLVDGDLANNNGGWQWAASTGTDVQPYFRVFNPALQGERFDPDGAYVRAWVPELARVPARWIHRPSEAPPLELAAAGVTLGETYPAPIVDHAERRDEAIEMYREAVG